MIAAHIDEGLVENALTRAARSIVASRAVPQGRPPSYIPVCSTPNSTALRAAGLLPDVGAFGRGLWDCGAAS